MSMTAPVEDLKSLASALGNDTDHDGKVSREELQSALSNLDDCLSVEVLRGDHASGSTTKVTAGKKRHTSGTLHLDGISEAHASGSLAPDCMCTPKSTARTVHVQPFQAKKEAEKRVKEIMNMFDTDNNGVLDHREQMQMYRTIIQKLETERKKEAANRDYVSTAAIRDQIQLLRKKLLELDCNNERRRQQNQKQLFERAMTARADILTKQVNRHTQQTEATVAAKIKLTEQRAQLESQMLARDLASWPRPKPRYSKGLIEMRHAEMALATDQRYEEAQNVRATTKVREAEEYDALLQSFEHKKVHARSLMENKHTFDQGRLHETVKDLRWRARRQNRESLELEAQCRQNHEMAMNHMLKMEMHKVMGTTHNIALPAHRRPRPDTNASCRGSRLKDKYVGKRHLAIPSLSQNHNFKGPETFALQEYTTSVTRRRIL